MALSPPSTDPQLDALCLEVRRLRDAIEAAPRVYSAVVTFVAAPTVRLQRDIPVVVEETADEVTVTWPEADVTGLGSSRAEAFAAFEVELVELFFDLAGSDDSELGPLPLRWKGMLAATLEAR